MITGLREREFVGRANSYQTTCLLSGKSLLQSYIFRGQLILCLNEDGTQACGLLSSRNRVTDFQRYTNGRFDEIAATLDRRVKTGDKSKQDWSMVKYYANIKKKSESERKKKLCLQRTALLSTKCKLDDKAGLIMNMQSLHRNRSTIRKQSGNSTLWMSDKSGRPIS